MDGSLQVFGVAGHAHDGVHNARHLGLIVPEHVDEIVLQEIRVLLPGDFTIEEVGSAVGVEAGESVQILVMIGFAGQHMIEENGSECFVHMKPQDFTQAGEACHGDVLEFVHMADFIRIAQAAQDAVVEDAADGGGLALYIALQIGMNCLGQGNALHEVKFLARHDIAVEMNAVIVFVNLGDSADEVITVYIGSEGVVLHGSFHFGNCAHMEVLFQGIYEGLVFSRSGILDSLDVAQGTVG